MDKTSLDCRGQKNAIKRLWEGSIINKCLDSVTSKGKIHFVDEATSLISPEVCSELHSWVSKEHCWEQFTVNSSLGAPEGCPSRDGKESMIVCFQ